MALVILMVGALFPAVGDSIGKLDLPEGVTTLLGGADYGTITGWMRSEIGAVYGLLVVAFTGISVAAGTAGEEEAGILALTLAHPIERSRLLLAKSRSASSWSRSAHSSGSSSELLSAEAGSGWRTLVRSPCISRSSAGLWAQLPSPLPG
jgi:hypothetical protein